MKRIALIALAFVALSAVATAQKKFEGTILYALEINTADMDPTRAAMMPTEKTTTIKGDWVKEQLEAAFGTINSVIDTKNEESTTFMDVMGNKMAFKLNKAQLDKMREKKPKMEITLAPETKTIAGYTCKKAIAKNTEDNTTVDIWYTEELAPIMNAEGNMFKEIKGLLMEFHSEMMGGVDMKVTAKKLTAAKVDDAQFAIPADYKMMTLDEMKQMGMKIE